MTATLDFHVSHDFSIDPETVFDYVADPLHDTEWCPLIAACEQIEGVEGRLS